MPELESPSPLSREQPAIEKKAMRATSQITLFGCFISSPVDINIILFDKKKSFFEFLLFPTSNS
jgi:hypothetical protein